MPVFRLSGDYSFDDWNPKPVQYHQDLAGELGRLRRRRVLVVGSGNLVHNLARLDGDTDAAPYPWAVEFDRRGRSCLLAGNHGDLIAFQTLGPSPPLAVPTLDHYLPLVHVLALQEGGEPLTFPHEGIQNASISMRCFQVG